MTETTHTCRRVSYYFEEHDEYSSSTGGLQILSPLKSAFLPCIHNQTTLHADGSPDGLEAVTSSAIGLMRTALEHVFLLLSTRALVLVARPSSSYCR